MVLFSPPVNFFHGGFYLFEFDKRNKGKEGWLRFLFFFEIIPKKSVYIKAILEIVGKLVRLLYLAYLWIISCQVYFHGEFVPS